MKVETLGMIMHIGCNYKDNLVQMLGVVNVYAPYIPQKGSCCRNNSYANCQETIGGFFIGDWNFEERSAEKSNFEKSVKMKDKKLVFEEFKVIFQMEDPFPPTNRIRFT